MSGDQRIRAAKSEIDYQINELIEHLDAIHRKERDHMQKLIDEKDTKLDTICEKCNITCYKKECKEREL